jgi:hypothetical protein
MGNGENSKERKGNIRKRGMRRRGGGGGEIKRYAEMMSWRIRRKVRGILGKEECGGEEEEEER